MLNMSQGKLEAGLGWGEAEGGPGIATYMLSRLSCVQLFVTLWTVACQAPLPMEFSRHEYWSGLPFPSPGDLSDPGIEPGSPALQAYSLPSEPPGEPHQGSDTSPNKENT